MAAASAPGKSDSETDSDNEDDKPIPTDSSSSSSSAASASASSAAAAVAVEVPEPQSQQQVAERSSVLWLRTRSKDKLREYMKQLVNNKNFATLNSHLTEAEISAIQQKLKFPEGKPVFPGVVPGSVSDRPAMRIKDYTAVSKSKIYCSNLSMYFALAVYKYPKEDLTKKDGQWWKTNHPAEWEVSHLFDGVRPDCNPLNLALEPSDINKSRVFCRLLYEKKLNECRAVTNTTEEKAHTTASAYAHECCQKLHDPRCRFLHPDVGRPVDVALRKRREQIIANEKNKKEQNKSKKRKKS